MMYGWKREAPVGGPVRLARLKLVEARECGPGRKWQVEFTTPTLPPKTTGMEGRLACNPWFLLRSTYFLIPKPSQNWAPRQFMKSFQEEAEKLVQTKSPKISFLISLRNSINSRACYRAAWNNMKLVPNTSKKNARPLWISSIFSTQGSRVMNLRPLRSSKDAKLWSTSWKISTGSQIRLSTLV